MSIISGYNKEVAITKSDTVDLYPFLASKRLTDAIYVGGAGDIVVVDQSGNTSTLKGALAGTIIPVQARRVNDTDSSATDLVALYSV